MCECNEREYVCEVKASMCHCVYLPAKGEKVFIYWHGMPLGTMYVNVIAMLRDIRLCVSVW